MLAVWQDAELSEDWVERSDGEATDGGSVAASPGRLPSLTNGETIRIQPATENGGGDGGGNRYTPQWKRARPRDLFGKLELEALFEQTVPRTSSVGLSKISSLSVAKNSSLSNPRRSSPNLPKTSTLNEVRSVSETDYLADLDANVSPIMTRRASTHLSEDHKPSGKGARSAERVTLSESTASLKENTVPKQSFAADYKQRSVRFAHPNQPSPTSATPQRPTTPPNNSYGTDRTQSESPLKLFHDDYDTFTNERLSQLVSQLGDEKIEQPARQSLKKSQLASFHQRVSSATTQDMLNEARLIMSEIRDMTSPVKVLQGRQTNDSSSSPLSTPASQVYKHKLQVPSSQSAFSDWSQNTHSRNSAPSRNQSSTSPHNQLPKQDSTMPDRSAHTSRQDNNLTDLKSTPEASSAIPLSYNDNTCARAMINKVQTIYPEDASEYVQKIVQQYDMEFDTDKKIWVKRASSCLNTLSTSERNSDSLSDAFKDIEELPDVKDEHLIVNGASKDAIEKADTQSIRCTVQKPNDNGLHITQRFETAESTSPPLQIKTTLDHTEKGRSSPNIMDENLSQLNIPALPTPIISNIRSVLDFRQTPSIPFGSLHPKSTPLAPTPATVCPSINKKVENYNFDISSKKTAEETNRSDDQSFSASIGVLVRYLTDIEPYEPWWEQLKDLDLSGRCIESIYGLDSFCPNLVSLNVENNKLSCLNGLPSTLRVLKASTNTISSLTAFNHLVNLQYLNLSNNTINSLDGLASLVQLRQIFVENNRIDSLEGLQGLDGLLHLSAKRNRIKYVELKQLGLSRLLHLSLANNNISVVTDLSTLSSLVHLNLQGNQVIDLTVTTNLSRLRYINLSGNRIARLDIRPFRHLQTLCLDQTAVMSIIGLSEHTYLENLSVRSQSTDCLFSKDIVRIENLRALYLSGNYMDRFSFGNNKFGSLQVLELRAANLKSLPRLDETQLPNLRSLDISYNSILSINPIRNIHSLRNLNAANNCLRRLTETIEVLMDLPELMYLDLSSNDLSRGTIADSQKPNGGSRVEDSNRLKHALMREAMQCSSSSKRMKRLLKKEWFRHIMYEAIVYIACRNLVWHDGSAVTVDRIEQSQQLLARALIAKP